MKRRSFLATPLLLAPLRLRAQTQYPPVTRGVALRFPRDHGSHPEFRTEWWYITGWIEAPGAGATGMQITFFRTRTGIGESNPSRFAPRQLLFAHAAVSDPGIGRLLHDQRAAREGFGLAVAAEPDTDVRIDDWRLRRDGTGYEARIEAADFAFALAFVPAQPFLLHGDGGFSRKGPEPRQASYYYSFPQMRVSGSLAIRGRRMQVSGTAWLDHEWSSEILPEQAAGWDWVGLNLSDGGAFMAFRMRTRDGGTYWAGATHRGADGQVRVFSPAEVRFEPQRRWRSSRTQVEYPVSMRVSAGAIEFTVEPVMDDQELDSRASTGTIYWEGAVRAQRAGVPAGRGYLELTGYWRPLRV